MADIKELKRKRGSYKARITIFGNYLSQVSDFELDPCQVLELQARLDKLESFYDEFNEVQTQLECITDNLDVEINERTSVESEYYALVAQAKHKLVISKVDHDDDGKSTNSNSKRKVAQLPTINLPMFSGSYDNWLAFRDTFISLIHNDDDIDDINKFHYLKTSLQASAAEIIQSVDFSADNYTLAWDLLCGRFDNKRLLLSNHVSAIFDMESLEKESSVALRNMIDKINKHIRACQKLGEPVDSWDTLLIHLFSHKLDSKTFREWEGFKKRLDKTKSIRFKQFMEFMQERADFIETLERAQLSKTKRPNTLTKQNTKLKSMVSLSDNTNASSPGSNCPKCSGDHNLNTCSQFLALSIDERMSILPSLKVCYNCLRRGHYPKNCKKSGCKICNYKHHTLIHNQNKAKQIICNKPTQRSTASGPADVPPPHSIDNGAGAVPEPGHTRSIALPTNLTAHLHSVSSHDILLSTALIRCYDANNKEHIARALLDSGSSSCIMTETLFKKLKLPFMNTDNYIQGINNSLSPVTKMCRVHIKSLCESYCENVSCFVLPTITDNVPYKYVHLNIPTDIVLADPYYHTPAPIDMILGADIFWNLLGSERIILGSQKPILFQTRLGWVVSGPIKTGLENTFNKPLKCNFANIDNDKSSQSDDLQTQLTRFWQIEEVGHYESSTYSAEETRCEKHFIMNTTRLFNGRFCVRIPLKESPDVLGDSFQRAKRCFLSMERRNKCQISRDKMYKEFMAEYLSLGHMSECQAAEDKTSYFIPHHGVLRESSTTTKLRVVFNASAPSTSGISLNDIQMVGPTVQDDLTSILLRFRMYKYVLSADIEKMYRQVSIHPQDRHLLKVIWRDNETESLHTYKLNTVTYGTASAPFLATRCLKQVGLECKDKRVAEVILHDFYVDDLLTGADQLDEADSLRRQITDALASACMPLRKWKSNEHALISTQSDHSLVDLGIEKDNLFNKTLGLNWHTQTDTLCFPINIPETINNTKRDILSVIARIFDPLGLLSPCVIRMKMLLQRLWLEKLTWDQRLSTEVITAWTSLLRALPALNDLVISRCVVIDAYKQVEFHIFTDASERAYGACLYVRSIDAEGGVSVRLLMAKSRVSPIKCLTIPRLELCAAVIGARLYRKVKSSLRTQISDVVFWTDSMVVLGWLGMLPIKLNTFVRNRVSEILDTTSSCTWRHVSTHDNPADLISRGVEATTLQSLDLWWSGPSFLRKDNRSWPFTEDKVQSLPELKTNICLHNSNHEKHLLVINFERFSNLRRLQRTVATTVFRFIKICRRQSVDGQCLSTHELQNSLNFIIIQSQRESFHEYNLLLKNEKLPFKNRLLKYNVFLDKNKIIRLGGRLHNSEYSFEKKHPILLQSTHHFTKLLFNYEHRKLMHAGPQLLLATIRETYWPLGGRNLARACYRQCVRCRRLKGQNVQPQMGNLPSSRLSPADFPFQNVGVDYAGPIMSASRQGRGCRLLKVYIVVFVCFTTKAIHLELVGDLTSSNYLQALRRFISRRGKPLNIYSDNGTSFVGVYNELSSFLRRNCGSMAESVAHDGIHFHFIPAYAPHFGGLWEAGVKSTKHHLIRVLGNCHLTYEELNSTLTQIEAILNSRPLTPLSSNSEDLLPLTPGHFLIGRPLISLPVEDLRHRHYDHLTRHQRIEQLRQHFWARWSKEYVSELQQRVKWQACKDSLKVDTLVVIKDDNLPPLKWKLGRVIALYPGSDNVCRVAEIRTADGVVKRAASRICPLLATSG